MFDVANFLIKHDTQNIKSVYHRILCKLHIYKLQVVLNLDQNDIKESTEWTELISKFQSFGPVTEKVREPKTVQAWAHLEL